MMFFMRPEQGGVGGWGARGGEEVTPPSPLYPVPLAPSQNITLQQQQREERRVLDHRPPRLMETDRQTETGRTGGDVGGQEITARDGED